MTGYEHIEHTFAPVYDADSLVLILGTLPSVKSRENHFYYGHKQNRFWKVMADLCGEPVPETIEEKKKMLLTHHIAIWDVIQSCDIKGSSDSSIRNVEPTDIRRILAESQITRIYANGNKAGVRCTTFTGNQLRCMTYIAFFHVCYLLILVMCMMMWFYHYIFAYSFNMFFALFFSFNFLSSLSYRCLLFPQICGTLYFTT